MTAGSVVAVVTTTHGDMMTKCLSLEVRGVDGRVNLVLGVGIRRYGLGVEWEQI